MENDTRTPSFMQIFFYITTRVGVVRSGKVIIFTLIAALSLVFSRAARSGVLGRPADGSGTDGAVAIDRRELGDARRVTNDLPRREMARRRISNSPICQGAMRIISYFKIFPRTAFRSSRATRRGALGTAFAAK